MAARSGRHVMPEVKVLLPVLALALWLGACIPGSDGKFHACLTTSSGAIRLVDTDNGQTCGAGETAVSWHQSPVQRLGGGVSFLDKADTTGYLGTVDQVAVPLAAADAAFTADLAGVVSGFKGMHQAGGADVTFTLFKNGSATGAACTAAGAATSCTSATAVSVTAGDTLVVRITQPGSTFTRLVRWSAQLKAS